MKKIVLIMTVTVLSLIPPLSKFSHQEDKDKRISYGNSFILVKFHKDVDDGKKFYLKPADLQSRHIRKILKHYEVESMQAVYRNRYSKDGKLIPNKKYADATSTFRYIMSNDSTRAKEIAFLLQKEKGVLLAIPESPITINYFVEPDDTAYGSQWYLNSEDYPSADIDAEKAWNIHVGRNDVIVAVCDGGIDYTHDDLDPGDRSRIIAGYDTGSGDNDPMDDLPDHTSLSYAGHGTSVAGIIGAITNNNNDISGIMWNCKIMPVKMVGSGTIKFPFAGTVVDFSTTALPGDVADAIDFAVNNDANIINLSYGFKDLGWPIGDIILRWPHVYEAILNAYNNNVVVVAAMGNEYTDGNPVEYPAGFGLEVIAVGNTNEALQRSSTSNTGQHIDLAAPGSSILTTKRGGGTVTSGGTSMSAPIVSGISGLLLSQGKDRNMNLTNDDIRHILEITADDITPPGFDEETGYGKVNAYNALSLIDEPNTLVHGTSIGGQSVYQATLNWVYIGQRWNLASGVYYGVKRYQITKHIEFDVPFCSAPEVWIRERESISISAANPNIGYPWAEITNITQTGFDVKYYAFFIQYNLLGQTINKWIPSQPAATKIEYTAVGVPNIAATAGPITGPSIVCSPGVFTVQNLPPGCSITWNPGPYLTMTSQQGSNPCTFAANGSGASWVEATITSSTCGSKVLPKLNFWVGAPPYPVITSNQPYTIYVSGDIVLNDTNVETYGGLVQYFQWTWNSDDVCCLYDMTAGYQMFYGAFPGTVRIRTKVQNTCGSTDWSEPVFVEVIEEGFFMFPNPASDNVQVTIPYEPGQETKLFTVRIFNIYGVQVYSSKKSGNKFDLSISTLQNGIYIVEVYDGKSAKRKQLAVKRN